MENIAYVSYNILMKMYSSISSSVKNYTLIISHISMKTRNNLDILKLDGCDEITAVSVEKVINGCINLSYLDLSRYHFID